MASSQDLLQFYTSFKGRATRYDFNVRYALVAVVGSIVASILDFTMVGGDIFAYANSETNFFSTFWNLLMIVPTFAVICRRLHDLDFSGWWQLFAHGFFVVTIAIIVVSIGVMAFAMNPYVAGAGGLFTLGAACIMYLVFWLALSVMRGTKGPNKYGLDPLEEMTK